jgi:hypothetical protein
VSTGKPFWIGLLGVIAGALAGYQTNSLTSPEPTERVTVKEVRVTQDASADQLATAQATGTREGYAAGVLEVQRDAYAAGLLVVAKVAPGEPVEWRWATPEEVSRAWAEATAKRLHEEDVKAATGTAPKSAR